MSKTISIQEASNELAINLERYEWFCDTAIEGRNIVVYVDRMDKEVSDVIPDYLYGYQIKLWFSDYLFCDEKYAAKPMSQWKSFVREESLDF
jgi:hypothetical protein